MFLLLRDFIYQFLFKKHGKQYALREYKSMFAFLLIPHYVAIIGAMALFQFKAGIKIWFDPKLLINKLFYGAILFSPFYFLVKYLHKYLPELVEEDFIELTLKEKRKVYWFIAVGFLSMFLVPWLLDLFIPDNLLK